MGLKFNIPQVYVFFDSISITCNLFIECFLIFHFLGDIYVFYFLIIYLTGLVSPLFQLSCIKYDLLEMDIIVSTRESSLTEQLIHRKHPFFIHESRYSK